MSSQGCFAAGLILLLSPVAARTVYALHAVQIEPHEREARASVPRGADVQENPHRQSRRNRLPRHQDGAPTGDRDGCGLLGGRQGRSSRRPGGRGGGDRTAGGGAILSRHRQDRRRLPEDRRRGGPPRLRLSLRARGLRPGARRQGDRVHRPQHARHRGDGRQDRIEEIRQRRQGLDRSRLSRRDRDAGARRGDRRRDRLSGDDQGVRRRRRQGHAHRLEPPGGVRRLRPRQVGGQEFVRRRSRVRREVHRQSAPHRDPGARRQAWERHLSRRARVLDPAPQPEGDRGGALAAHRRGDAAQDGRAGGRAGQGRRLQIPPARSSSSPARIAASTSSR